MEATSVVTRILSVLSVNCKLNIPFWSEMNVVISEASPILTDMDTLLRASKVPQVNEIKSTVSYGRDKAYYQFIIFPNNRKKKKITRFSRISIWT